MGDITGLYVLSKPQPNSSSDNCSSEPTDDRSDDLSDKCLERRRKIAADLRNLGDNAGEWWLGNVGAENDL